MEVETWERLYYILAIRIIARSVFTVTEITVPATMRNILKICTRDCKIFACILEIFRLE